jgi:hypothetical protein
MSPEPPPADIIAVCCGLDVRNDPTRPLERAWDRDSAQRRALVLAPTSCSVRGAGNPQSHGMGGVRRVPRKRKRPSRERLDADLNEQRLEPLEAIRRRRGQRGPRLRLARRHRYAGGRGRRRRGAIGVAGGLSTLPRGLLEIDGDDARESNRNPSARRRNTLRVGDLGCSGENLTRQAPDRPSRAVRRGGDGALISPSWSPVLRRARG